MRALPTLTSDVITVDGQEHHVGEVITTHAYDTMRLLAVYAWSTDALRWVEVPPEFIAPAKSKRRTRRG